MNDLIPINLVDLINRAWAG